MPDTPGQGRTKAYPWGSALDAVDGLVPASDAP